MTLIGDDIVESVMADLQRIVSAYSGPNMPMYEPEISIARQKIKKAKDLLDWLHQDHREHVKDMVAYANREIAQHHSAPAASPASTDPLADLDVQTIIGQIEQLR